MEEEPAKEDEDDGIDKVSQAGLENEALRRRVDIGPPIQGNEDAGPGNIRPLPALLPDPFQVGQELFLYDEEKAEDRRPDNARGQRVQRRQLPQQQPERRQDAPYGLT